MLTATLVFALAQSVGAAATEDPIAFQAAECGVQYKIREVNAQTDEGRSLNVRNQKFMIALMMDRNLPVARFEEIGGAYKTRFMDTVQKDDAQAAEFLKSEILRCDLFVKEQAGELVKKGYGSGG
ncbi:hypothetical protein QLQ15_09400 [Lysobacter sp. LF1]|uniref:Uncharacterized protein n=1 Tax=Lysobacter stagni TaxID=3045172 RepID=A0ABT6XG50_9GAMM|nr:hypothetical protein [Lysobacter sp. LF1]MDI9239124.1 hypothetical protein [Lysobacter sp. LF1]